MSENNTETKTKLKVEITFEGDEVARFLEYKERNHFRTNTQMIYKLVMEKVDETAEVPVNAG